MRKATDYVCHPHVYQPETKRLTAKGRQKRAGEVLHTQHINEFKQFNAAFTHFCLQLLLCLTSSMIRTETLLSDTSSTNAVILQKVKKLPTIQT